MTAWFGPSVPHTLDRLPVVVCPGEGVGQHRCNACFGVYPPLAQNESVLSGRSRCVSPGDVNWVHGEQIFEAVDLMAGGVCQGQDAMGGCDKERDVAEIFTVKRVNNTNVCRGAEKRSDAPEVGTDVR